MTEKEFRHKKHQIQKKNVEYRQKMELKSLRKKYNGIKKLSTSKIILLFVCVLSLQIILFSEYIMLKFGDFSAVYALIGIPATMVPTLVSYYQKSAKENQAGGIVYDMAMLDRENVADSLEDDEEGVG